MLLLLVRHARAGQRDPARWPDDTERPITDQGHTIQRRMSRALARLRLEPEAVFTSPWLRARQTADVLVGTLKLDGAPIPCDPLAAEPDLEKLQDAIGTRGPDAVVALVGHEPWMGELASLLLGGSTSRVRIDFPKSGVMGLELPMLAPGTGTLNFFLRPGQVRRLSK